MKSFLLSGVLILFFFKIQSQDSTNKQKPTVEILGFVDAFYAYDFNKPSTVMKHPFFFNHNRHNEFNINMALIDFKISHEKYRLNLGLHAGTYGNDNYAAEPGLLKNIYEANVGISLNKANNLWIDAGVFGSHLGFESAISIENPTLTRSFIAESSPYFLSGVKLSYQPNDKWDISFTVCNGWQRIQRLQDNSLPGFGSQIQFKPSKKTTLNWSTYAGSEYPDAIRRMRYFNDFYGLFDLTKKTSLIVGFDIGLEQKTHSSSEYYNWFTPIIIGQYKISKKLQTAIRFEYFHDENNVIILTNTINGFQTFSSSLNLDYTPLKNVALRLEGRYLTSKDQVFSIEDIPYQSNSNFFITASLAIKFNEKLSK